MAGNDRFFPLFIDMNGKKVLVIGGGKVSQRRVLTLVDFGADVTVISPALTDKLKELADVGQINVVQRAYQDGDVNQYEPFLVIAATDQREVNHAVKQEAQKQNILVIIADKREECDAYFPALAENETYIAGFTSKTGNHKGVKEMTEQIRRQMEHA